MSTSQELGDREPLQYGLSPDQEVFLFGNQGQLADEESCFSIMHYKMGFAREWLAAYVSVDEVPQEFIDNMNRENAQMLNDFGVGIETFGVKNPHPLSLALHREQNTQQPLEERAILSTVLLHALDNSSEDPEIKDKLDYVLVLFEEYDKHLSNSGRMGGDVSPYTFPAPVNSYQSRQFPVGLVPGLGLLF